MLVSHHPAPLGGLVRGVEFSTEFPQMLPGVIEVYDFDSAGELFRSDVPDPIGSIAYHDFGLCPAPTTLMSFGVDATGELAGSLNGPGVGGGFLIAHGFALVIGGGLSKNATEFGVAVMCSAVFSLSTSSLSLFGCDRHTGGVELDVHHGKGLAHGYG